MYSAIKARERGVDKHTFFSFHICCDKASGDEAAFFELVNLIIRKPSRIKEVAISLL